VETVEKCLKPLCGLKNGVGKLVGKSAFFHRLVHTNRREGDASNTNSIWTGAFPAIRKAKPFVKKGEKFTVIARFPQFPQGVENFLWKTKAFRHKAFPNLRTFCPRRFQHFQSKNGQCFFIR